MNLAQATAAYEPRYLWAYSVTISMSSDLPREGNDCTLTMCGLILVKELRRFSLGVGDIGRSAVRPGTTQ